jgi:hypothetical protein
MKNCLETTDAKWHYNVLSRHAVQKVAGTRRVPSADHQQASQLLMVTEHGICQIRGFVEWNGASPSARVVC